MNAETVQKDLQDFYYLRPEVREFAAKMEERLRANSHKGHWRGKNPLDLLDRIDEELLELEGAVGNKDKDAIKHEAADVANFAMMISDNAK